MNGGIGRIGLIMLIRLANIRPGLTTCNLEIQGTVVLLGIQSNLMVGRHVRNV